MVKVAGWSPIADLCYPRVVMPSLFIHGCNFRCPYCINRDLVVGPNDQKIDLQSLLFQFKIMREKWVCVTGAEALMNPDLPSLLMELRQLGFQVALSTNGTFFDRLKSVCERGLVNHVVMDIKTSLELEKYRKVAGISMSPKMLNNVSKSIDFLEETKIVTHEFRTTMCAKFVDFSDVENIVRRIEGAHLYVMQLYTTHQTLVPELADEKYVIPYETLQDWAEKVSPFVKKVLVREV